MDIRTYFLFFVLESLYNRAIISVSGNIPSFLVLTFDYFSYYNSCNLASDNIIIRHFTDLLRIASELVEVGVRFKSYIIDYVVVLDFPINTNRDVDALIQNDVIVNWLGDTDSMTNNYNGPWKNITQLNFCSHYIHLCLDLNAFCTLMNYKDIVNDIKGMLERAESPITSDCCIYRVPFDISLLNQDVYIPKVVSISHIHHLNPRLQNMEIHKLIYFNKFLNLVILVIHVEEAEPNVRRSYDDTLDLTTEELVKIILVDSCLIIELFWRFCYNEWSGCDVFLLKPWLTTKIRLDLLLIENQLPFFVLESIYNRALISSSVVIWLVKNIIIRHFTDLLKMFHLQQPIKRTPPSIEVSVVHLQSAGELVEARVRFKFCNLVASELCHNPYKSYITNYVVVLDFLINTDRGVDALIQNDVLVNWLGDTDSMNNVYNGLRKILLT
ncbi:hypothetical protein Lal_00008099 [Lupinus albus]|nr:hypothetical protein Lal_00008099 [Lupinus albus]